MEAGHFLEVPLVRTQRCDNNLVVMEDALVETILLYYNLNWYILALRELILPFQLHKKLQTTLNYRLTGFVLQTIVCFKSISSVLNETSQREPAKIIGSFRERACIKQACSTNVLLTEANEHVRHYVTTNY